MNVSKIFTRRAEHRLSVESSTRSGLPEGRNAACLTEAITEVKRQVPRPPVSTICSPRGRRFASRIADGEASGEYGGGGGIGGDNGSSEES